MIVRVLFIALLALIAAVIAAHFIAADPGFIVIGYGGKVVRTTFSFFVVAILLAMGALYLLLRALGNLIALRRRWRRWSEDYRRRRAHRSLANGMLALAAGDFARAERLFSRGVDEGTQPEVHYLAAAEAAQAMKATARRDNYLRLAHDVQPEAAAALDLKRAAWLLDNGQLEEARELIDRLAATQVSSPQLLRLRMRVLEGQNAVRELVQLLPALRRERVITHDEGNALERVCAVSELQGQQGTALQDVWDSLSKPVQAAPAVVVEYVRGLCRGGQHEEAEKVLSRQIERSWDSDLAALYGEIAHEPPSHQIRKADAWAQAHADDPGLRLTRARLAIRGGLWGQARTHLEHLIAHAPSPVLHRLMAEVADGIGDDGAARWHRKKGLELATK